MKFVRRCPLCKSVDTIRSHRKHLEYLLLAIKPYRCNDCQHRFYSFISSHPVTQESGFR